MRFNGKPELQAYFNSSRVHPAQNIIILSLEFGS